MKKLQREKNTIDIEYELLKAISRGDSKSFDQLFIFYFPKLKKFLSGFVSVEEAEDLAQDVFVKLWNTRERLIWVENFKAYLYRIAKNTLYTYLDSNLNREYLEMSETTEVLSSESLEDLLLAKELEEIIDKRVELMPSQRKTIFCMSRKQGLSNDEIAKTLNLSKRTVEAHLYNALLDIRKIVSSLLLFFY